PGRRRARGPAARPRAGPPPARHPAHAPHARPAAAAGARGAAAADDRLGAGALTPGEGSATVSRQHPSPAARAPRMAARVVDSADVDPRAELGDGTSVWHLAQVREEAVVGPDCVIGRGAYIGTGVRMGRGCKVQNYALVYAPAVLEDGVFVGPAAVLTNDTYPRAVNPDLSPKGDRKSTRLNS